MTRKSVLTLGVLGIVLMLVACAPRFQEIGAVIGAPEFDPASVTMADGTRLPLRTWRAPEPRAVIVGVHGMNDYGNAFAMPGAWFAKRGITTYAYDQRGFGETDQRGLWAGAGIMVDDMLAVTELIAQRHPGVPLYVLGLSMGGAVTMVAKTRGLNADGIILAAPAIWGWQAMNPVYKASLWVAAHTIPTKTASGSGLEIWPSDNVEMLREFSRDPHVLKASRIDAVYGLVTLMDQAYDAADDLDGPVLYLYGRNDQIVPAAPTYRVMGRIRAERRLVVYENGYHMLLRDLQRETVWTDILTWIDDRTAPLPSGEEVDDASALAGAAVRASETAPVADRSARRRTTLQPR